MINTKKELKFYIMADRIMNGFPKKISFKEFFFGWTYLEAPVIKYLRIMRLLSYYDNSKSIVNRVFERLVRIYYNRLGLKLSIRICPNVCGYGIVVPHYGLIRIGISNQIGNYTVIHSGVTMTGSSCVVGDYAYFSSGCKIIGPLELGNSVSIAANSVVNKSYGDNVLLAGAPAKVVKENYPSWYERDGDSFQQRVNKVEELKKQMGL